MEQEFIGQVVWKYSDGAIEDLDRLVISAPSDIDPVLRPLQLVLEVLEVLVCLEVRVALDDEHES